MGVIERLRGWWRSQRASGLDWSLLLLPGISVYALVFLLRALLTGGPAVLASLRRQPGLSAGLLGAVALMLLSGWLNHSSADGQLRILNWLPYLWFFGVFQAPLGRVDRFLKAARWLVYGAVPTAVVALGSLLLRWQPALMDGRVRLHFGHPNWLAGYLLLGAAVAWLLRRWPGPHSPMLWRGAALICVLGAATGQSRNSVFTLLAIAATDALLGRPLPRWCNRRLGWGLLLGLTAVGVWLWRSPEALASLRDLLDATLLSRESNYDPAAVPTQRQNLWRLALEWLGQSPIWGLGPGGFMERFVAQHHGLWIAHPHNFWLVTAVEYGIPAMLLLFGSLVWAVGPAVGQYVARVRSLRRADPAPLTPAAALVPSLTGLLVFNLVDDSVFCLQINLPAWFLFTAAVGLSRVPVDALTDTAGDDTVPR